ncbi:cyclin-P [Ambystoma mexicanum]|uniref:cyclin-P n=1 Tax=Ambystoma mexicanum TaxID=8296 RepID=UPI0037E8655A
MELEKPTRCYDLKEKTVISKMPDRKREPLVCKDNNTILEAEKVNKKKRCPATPFRAVTSNVCRDEQAVLDNQSCVRPGAVGCRGRLLLAPSLLLEEDLKQAMANMGMHVEKEYAYEIFLNMMKEQVACCFKISDVPRRVTGGMRAILVDWLIQVHEFFGFQEETLYLAIYLMNLYLKTSDIRVSKLQLLGATCLYLACKIEECTFPEPNELCFMMADTFDKQDLLCMERRVLSHLKFELRYTQPLHFLRLLATAGNHSMEENYSFVQEPVEQLVLRETGSPGPQPNDSVVCPVPEPVASRNGTPCHHPKNIQQKEVLYLAMYFMELMLMETEAVTFEPAQLAAAGLCLAQKVLQETGKHSFDGAYKLYTYSDSEVSHIQHLMARTALRANTSDTNATHLKYCKPTRMSVSIGPALAGSQYLSSLAIPSSSSRNDAQT